MTFDGFMMQHDDDLLEIFGKVFAGGGDDISATDNVATNFSTSLLTRLQQLPVAILAMTIECFKIKNIVTCKSMEIVEENILKLYEEEQSYEICLAAVQQCGMALQFVTENMRTHEICLAAVQQDSWALSCVTENMQTSEICLAAVQQNGDALMYVKKTMQTPKVCLAAVQQCGLALQFVPKTMQTPKVCLAAVQQNGNALMYVKKHMQTPELCMVAYQQKRCVLESLDKHLRYALRNVCNHRPTNQRGIRKKHINHPPSDSKTKKY